jgi:hypothetical protein
VLRCCQALLGRIEIVSIIVFLLIKNVVRHGCGKTVNRAIVYFSYLVLTKKIACSAVACSVHGLARSFLICYCVLEVKYTTGVLLYFFIKKSTIIFD